MNEESVILILGRRDHPTDGVADYCEKLREAGPAGGLRFELMQVPWAERGWARALAELREAAADWRGRWALLQFTTLAWSRRGFPLRAPKVLEVLQQTGVRPGVVFHDFSALAGRGIVAGAREYCQLRALQRLYALSKVAVFTVPLKQVSWLPLRRGKATFIPVGANCPELRSSTHSTLRNQFTVAVYGVTGGSQMSREVSDIVLVLNEVARAGCPVRLLLFGRNSREAEPTIRSALADSKLELEVLGLLSPEQVSAAFARSDVLLFVRGHISTRRGSAIAAIACGVPIVCYSGQETDWPITEAGILAVPIRDRQALAGALENVLSDPQLRKALSERSRNAQTKYFSWEAIVANFDAAIRHLSPVGASEMTTESREVQAT